MSRMLHNPIYYGGFRWDGELYHGTHEPIVSRELWDTVQDMLSGRAKRRTGFRKHRWAFQGMIACGHCGCALVAEGKRGERCVYYRCTGHKGKCGEPYVREEVLAAQYGEHLKAIQFTPETIAWVSEVLKESHRDEVEYHRERLQALHAQYTKLQNRLDAAYDDKLDGKITDDMYTRKSQEWREEQEQIRRQIERLEHANRSYIDDGARILELAQKAHTLYERQDPLEKRRLLQIVFSNSTYARGILTCTYNKPFDLLAQATIEAKKRVAEDVPSDPSSKWQG